MCACVERDSERARGESVSECVSMSKRESEIGSERDYTNVSACEWSLYVR